MADDGRVVVHIDGDDSGLQNSLNDANQAIRNASAQMSQSANTAASSVNSMTGAFGSVNSAAGSAASAASSASSAIGAAASGTQTASDAAVDYSGALAQMQSTMSQAVSVLGNMDGTLTEVADGMRQTGENTDKTDSIMQKLGGTLKTVFSVAMIKEFASAVYDVGSSYEYSLSKVQSIADTASVSIEQISGDVLKLSSDTGTAAAEINEAVYQAISASVDTADAVSTVEVAVKSAKAGFTDTATAIDGLTTVMNSFKTANLEADDVANKFLITQNLGKTSFGELASAIGNVAPTANAAGVSIEELLSATASLTANGIATSQAMTGLKAAMSNIITPSSNAKKMAAELGIQFDAAALKSKGLSGMMQEIAEATQGDTEKMAQLFGSVEALNTMLTLTSEGGAELFDKTMSEMATNTTALDNAYSTMTDNVQSKTEIMKTAAENFGIDIYQSISGGLGDAVGTVTEYIDRLHDAFMNGGISELGGELFQIAFDAVGELGNGIAQALPELIPEALQTVVTIADTIIDNIDTVIDTAENIIQGLADALTDPKTLDILLTKAPEIVVKLVDTMINEIDDVIRFVLDFCQRCADALVDYDWSEAARQMINNLADALDEAQKEVAITLDNLFTGGSVYGGNKDNVQIGADVFLSADSIREGADAVVDAIDAGESSIRSAYERGQDELDEVFKNDRTELNLEWQSSVMNGYAENARNAAHIMTQANAEVSDSAAETAEVIEESGNITAAASDKVSEKFKTFYENLKLEKAMGHISNDEYIAKLSAMLNSSSEYASAAYTKYWQEITKSNNTAAKTAEKKVSDDFKSFYENQKLLLSMGEENGGISEEAFYKNLEEKLNSIPDSKINAAYAQYWNALKTFNEKQEKAVREQREKVSDEFKKWNAEQELLLQKGEITEYQYIENLRTMLHSSDEFDAVQYTSFWKKVSDADEKAANEALKKQQEAAKKELSQLKSSTDDLVNEYKEKLNKIQNEKKNFESKLNESVLSSSETVTVDKRTGEASKTRMDIAAAMKKKIQAREKLGNALQSLVRKHIPKSMLSELAGMDPEDALKFAEQLDRMDTNKWESMVETYTEYETINKKISEDVYGPQLEELNKQFTEDLTGLLGDVTGEAAKKGSEYILNFISGIDTSSGEAIEDVKKYIDKIVSEMNEEISDSKLVNGEMTLGLDKVDGEKVGKNLAGQLADGIGKNSKEITSAVKKAVEKEMQNIKIAVEAKIKTIVDNYSVPASAQQTAQQQKTVEKVVEKIVYRDVKLVWKDGRTLAEVVNNENNRRKVEGGRV